MVNFYELIDDEFKEPIPDYPNRKKVNLRFPSIWTINGGTGTGKTNCLFDIIKKVGRFFNRYYLFAKDLEEPLYKWFITKIRDIEDLHDVELLTIYDNIDDLPNIKDIDKNLNNLFIFDDMIAEKDKNLKKVGEYAIRVRKKNGTIMFLSQDYFETPKLFRKQQNYCVLTGINTYGDLNNILRECSLTIPPEVLREMYKKVQNLDSGQPKKLDDYFLIDNVFKYPLSRCRYQLEIMDPRPYYEKVGLPIPDFVDAHPNDDEMHKSNKSKKKKRKHADSNKEEKDQLPLTEFWENEHKHLLEDIPKKIKPLTESGPVPLIYQGGLVETKEAKRPKLSKKPMKPDPIVPKKVKRPRQTF